MYPSGDARRPREGVRPRRKGGRRGEECQSERDSSVYLSSVSSEARTGRGTGLMTQRRYCCFPYSSASVCQSEHPRVCFGAVRGVQTGARRASQNTRVCGVRNKGKGAGSRQPLAVSRRCFTHRALSFPHPCIPSATLNCRAKTTYRTTHSEGTTLSHAGGGDLLTKVVVYGNFSTSDGCRGWNFVWANTLMRGHGGAYAPW